MNYLRVNWIHQHPGEPVILYSELDEERVECRKIDIYRDGRWGFADAGEEIGGTLLAEESIPCVEEINSDPQFQATEVEEEEFETLWAARKSARIMAPSPLQHGGGELN